MKKVKLVVVMPTRHNEIDRAIDTIDSILHYTTDDRLIILLIDSEEDVGLDKLYPNLMVIKTKPGNGPYGRLYVDIAKVFVYVLDNYEFDAILRLDADGLIIGQNPEKDAISYFKENPSIGLLGSYQKDCNGDIRDFGPVRKMLARETGFVAGLTKPTTKVVLNKLLRDATKNGYELGEHCLGAACFISYSCLRSLQRKGYLSLDCLNKSILGDDHILGLVVKASGYNIGDFATGGYPLGIRWKGLPMSLDELISRGKKIIHSTKSYENFNEFETREYFKKLRMI